MLVKKPLSPSEVPLQYHSWFDFEQQFMRPRPGGARSDAAIITKCKECVNSFPMLIASVRNTIRRGGKLLGLCNDCKVDRKWITDDGYVMMYKPGHPNARKDGKILEHIWVMSERLGRPLQEHENIHHKNGDRTDNALSNLELWSTFQPAGQRVVDKLRWARELTQLYPQEWNEINEVEFR